MAVGSDINAKVKRKWVAASVTSIKASTAASSVLAEHEKMVVEKNTQVTAVIEDEAPGYWIVADATVNDVPLTANLRFLFMQHWELQPQAGPVETAADEAEPLPVDESVRQETAEVAETEVAPQALPPTAAKPLFDSVPEPKLSKPVNHRRLFALFKRGNPKN